VGTYPSLERQFRSARPVLPFVRTGRLQRRLARAAGPDWAMLPHTAGFLDAWLSPGIAQSLFAVNRLAGILADGWGDAYREERLEEYGRTVIRELAWVDEITGTCFACFDRFPIMAAATMIYFTAATYCEERERKGEAGPDDAFLLADHAEFRSIADRLFTAAQTLPCSEAEWFLEEARRELAPFNRCGLCDPARRNMYPFIPAKR
jgi:FADH2 O2-dependent halogenase